MVLSSDNKHIFLIVPKEYYQVYKLLLVSMSNYGVSIVEDCTATCNGKNKHILNCWNLFQAACAAYGLGENKKSAFLINYIICQLKLDVEKVKVTDDNLNNGDGTTCPNVPTPAPTPTPTPTPNPNPGGSGSGEIKFYGLWLNIVSNKGTVITNGNYDNIVLTPYIYIEDKPINDSLLENLEWKWTRHSSNSDLDAIWNNAAKTNKRELNIIEEDMDDESVTFMCTVVYNNKTFTQSIQI